MELECSSSSASFAKNPPAAEETRQHRAAEGEKAKTQGKSGSSKAWALLLDTLFERMGRSADPTDMRTAAYIDALNPVDQNIRTNTTQSKVSAGWWMKTQADRLLVQADKLTISINCCYWRIGVSYLEFCKVR